MKMKLLFLVFFNGIMSRAVSELPEKLIHYQNVTGIDDDTILKIFDDQSLGGEFRFCIVLEFNFRSI